MKKNIVLNTWFLVCIMIVGCQAKTITDPKKVGDVVFEKLNSLNDDKEADFFEGFMTFEEFITLNKKDSLKSQSPIYTSLNPDKWKEEKRRSYISIKNEGASFKLNWSNIKFDNFIVSVNKNSIPNYASGILYFKHMGKSYLIYATAYFNGKEYKITEIYSLKEDKWGYAPNSK